MQNLPKVANYNYIAKEPKVKVTDKTRGVRKNEPPRHVDQTEAIAALRMARITMALLKTAQ